MADNLRIHSGLPLAIAATEPMPDEFKDKPGLAPALRSVVVKPGLNEFSGQDAEVYGKWAKGNPQFLASDEAVKAGETAGLVYEVKGEEAGDEYGFEPALKRASEGANADAATSGSTVTEPGPVKASDMVQTPAPAPAAAQATPAPISPAAKAAVAPVAPAK